MVTGGHKRSINCTKFNVNSAIGLLDFMTPLYPIGGIIDQQRITSFPFSGRKRRCFNYTHPFPKSRT